MDKLIQILYTPEDKHGLYKLLYQHKDTTYEAHVFYAEYKVRILKQKLVYELGYSEKYINEFEQVIRDMVDEENKWD